MKKYTHRIILLAAAVSLALCGFALAACGEHEHTYGAWQETVPAACETNGTRERICTVCGEKDTEDIPALGHKWGASKVTKAATCQEEGERTKTCSRCSVTQTETLEKIEHDWVPVVVIKAATCEAGGREQQACSMCGEPREADTKPLGHDWETETVRWATCEEGGLERKQCTRCDAHEEKETEPLGHQWKNTRVIEPATCEEAGEQEQTCQRPGCAETRTVELSALGHSWQNYYTVDKQPTFEAAGSKSYHCNRCEETSGETEIPKLEENKPIAYEFRTLRNNGQLLIAPTITLIVKDETGAEVARSTPADLNGGVFTKELLPKTYTVTAENLPGGYTCGAKFTVTPFDPYCNVYLTASLREGSPTGRYAVGDVMYDFSVPSDNSTGGALRLSDVLAAKKMVLLNFWYVDCTYCDQEFPELNRAYIKYRDVVEVIAVNQNDAMSAIKAYGMQNGLSFPLVQNAAVQLINPFGVRNYPTTVVIDGEGVICEIFEGAHSQAEFEAIFAKYTEDGYFRPSASTAAAILCEALPPVKRKTV